MSEKAPSSTVLRASLLEVAGEFEDLVLDDSATAWTKVTGRSGNKVYFQKREHVAQVHLSGWGKDRPGTVPPKANGKVQAWLDLSVPDPVVAFRDLLAELAAQPAPAPAAPKAAKEPAPSPKEGKPRAPKAKADLSFEQARIQQIRERARALGLGTDVELAADGSAKDPDAFADAVDAVARDIQENGPVDLIPTLEDAALLETEETVEATPEPTETAEVVDTAPEPPSYDEAELSA